MQCLRRLRVVPWLVLPLLAACGGGSSGGAASSLPGTLGSTPAPASSTPTPTPTNGPPGAASTSITHVMTADVLYGYGGTPSTTSLASVKPFITWVQTSPNNAPQIRAAGIKVDVYVNFWRNYSSDNPSVGYNDLRPGGPHASAEALDCLGHPIVDVDYGGGYEADARSSAAAGHASVVASYFLKEFGSNYDALFADDTGAVGGITLPCNFSPSSYEAAANAVSASLGVPLFVNTLGAGSYPDNQIQYAQADNVIGAMCEICYAGNSSSRGGDYAIGGSTWQHTENAEIAIVSMHKIFWDYARAIGDPSSETALREFIYASFLLTYDPSYAMLQEAFKTASGFPIMPETGLVPMNPKLTASTVAGYANGGIYMREFGDCYYRGSRVGACAVVVNPNAASASIPSNTYTHAMMLSGGAVLEGGSASFAAPAVTALAPDSGAILLK
jgi:hypothetical protein